MLYRNRNLWSSPHVVGFTTAAALLSACTSPASQTEAEPNGQSANASEAALPVAALEANLVQSLAAVRAWYSRGSEADLAQRLARTMEPTRAAAIAWQVVAYLTDTLTLGASGFGPVAQNAAQDALWSQLRALPSLAEHDGDAMAIHAALRQWQAAVPHNVTTLAANLPSALTDDVRAMDLVEDRIQLVLTVTLREAKTLAEYRMVQRALINAMAPIYVKLAQAVAVQRNEDPPRVNIPSMRAWLVRVVGDPSIDTSKIATTPLSEQPVPGLMHAVAAVRQLDDAIAALPPRTTVQAPVLPEPASPPS